MERWKLAVGLAVLLLLPRISAKSDDDDSRSEEGNEQEEEVDIDDNEVEGAEGGADKPSLGGGHRYRYHRPVSAAPRRTPVRPPSPTNQNRETLATRSFRIRPLECYICAHKAEMPNTACLDPVNLRVHTITCYALEESCFTSVTIAQGSFLESVVRGCKYRCNGTAGTRCCEHNRCNNQVLPMPLVQPRVSLMDRHDDSFPRLVVSSKSNTPPSILFFVSLMLILQTATKVAFV